MYIFIYFNWRLITLQYCIVLPYIDMNPPQVYVCSHPGPPSHLPPHPIPQGHSSAPALSTLSHALNLDWRSVSHIIIYYTDDNMMILETEDQAKIDLNAIVTHTISRG